VKRIAFTIVPLLLASLSGVFRARMAAPAQPPAELRYLSPVNGSIYIRRAATARCV
jgi:hypothetical protein